jgi:hypothetical protein
MALPRRGLSGLYQGALTVLGSLALWAAVTQWRSLPSAVSYDPTILPMAIGGGALLALAVAWRSPWRSTMALLGLAAAGQAGALQLIEAPRYAIYQHFVPWNRLFETPTLILGILIVQTVTCIIVAARAWPSLSTYPRILTRSWPKVGLVGFLGILSLATILAFATIVPTESVARAAGELVLAGWVTLIALLNLILVARAAPSEPLGRTVAWLDRRVTLDASREEPRPWDTLFPWLVAVWVVVIAGSVSWFVMEGVPHIDDSISYLFQAKYLSTGQLYLPAPPDSASFHVAETIVDGPKWFGYGFPGWPAVLALGAFVGVPWLVNPLIGGITVLVAHRVVRLLYDRSSANLTICLMGVSPWLIFTSASFMGHAVALAWGLLALLAVELERRRASGGWAVVAGVAIGALFLTRPIEALFVGSVALLWMLGLGGSRMRLRSVLAYAASAAGVAATVFLYNAALTGRALYAPHMMWTDRTWGAGVDRLGFGPSIGIPAWTNIDPLPGHGVVDVVLNANKNVFMANVDLFGWACGSLLLAILAVPLMSRRRADWLMIILVMVVVVGHSAYWFSGGPDLGPRYWYQALIPLIVLTVRGAAAVAHRASTRHPIRLHRIGVFVAAASLSAVITVLPWRSATKYYRYRDVSGEIRLLAKQHGFEHSLVFVRTQDRAVYQSAFNLNPRTLADSATIYAFDAGRAHRQEVVRHFANRPIWVIGPSSYADTRLGILAGPLSPGTVPPDSALRR